MGYGRGGDGYDGLGHGVKLEEGRRNEDEEREPSDLDAPLSDGLDDDELEEDEQGVAVGANGEGDDDDDDEDEPAGPLAEDVPLVPKKHRGNLSPAERELEAVARSAAAADQDDEGYELAATLEQERDVEQTPGVRRSGGNDVSAMSQADRQREFPAAPGGRRGKKSAVSRRRGRKRPTSRA